ncbi:hypothetical protein CYK37_28975 [Mesorhizobium loti]|nr:hypothetical protein CYK37_28975 [Mesorhizobium loti]
MVITAVAYIGAALLVGFDPESRSASPLQFMISAIIVVACFLAAWLLGSMFRTKPASDRDASSINPLRVLVVTLIPALVLASDILGESWTRFVFNSTVTVVVGAFIWWRAHDCRVGMYTIQPP